MCSFLKKHQTSIIAITITIAIIIIIIIIIIIKKIIIVYLYSADFITMSKSASQVPGADLGGGCRGCTPPPEIKFRIYVFTFKNFLAHCQ